jgi:hypothetical protein
MSDLLKWGTLELNRRRFLRRVAAISFGLFSGLAAGRPQIALATPPCTGPYGSGACAPENCSGSACTNQCGYYNLCQGNVSPACWTSAQGGTCCDCACNRPPVGTYFSYCYG